LKIPALDLAAQYDEMGTFMKGKLAESFARLGLEMLAFNVENITLPEEVEQAMDKRSSMGALGNLNNYSQFQAANALEDAANNQGGAGNMMGMMMGTQMAGGLSGALHQQQPHQQPAVAAPQAACPKCNAANDEASKFCGSCGQSMAPAGSQCIKCSAPISDSAKFCGECGSPQVIQCAQCGIELSPGTKFCGECGTRA